MKKFILGLFFLFIALDAYAQEHMTFEGIPIDGTADSFNEKLKQKGLRFTKEGEYVNYHGFNVTITPYTEEGTNEESLMVGISLDYYYDGVSDIDREGMANFRKYVLNDINQLCSSNLGLSHSVRPVLSLINNYSVYSISTIYNKQNNKDILGQITYDEEGWGFSFYDYKRRKLLSKSTLPLSDDNLKWYDFSNYLNNGSCFISTDDNNLYFKISRKEKNTTTEFSYILKDKDKNTLLYILNNGSYNTKKALIDFCVNYMGVGVLENYNMRFKEIRYANYNIRTLRAYQDMRLGEGFFNSYFEEFIEEQKKKEEQKQIAVGKKLTSVQFLKLLCPNVFSDYELKLAEQFLPADFLKRAIQASGNSSQNDFMKNASFATNKELNIH